MRYKIDFSYDGSVFNGYAKQPGEYTIQGNLEEKISLILQENVTIFAAGRTDKGVHALNQVAHFDTLKEIDVEKFKNSLNKLVDDAIYIKSVILVSDAFHSRFSAKAKIYKYLINYKEYDPLKRNYESFVPNVNFMKLSLIKDVFKGQHSFMNFCSKPLDEDNFIREIYEIDVARADGRIEITFKGNGFMRYEVRKIVGTMIAYSKDQITRDEIIDLLVSTDRKIVNFTAESKGLYLVDVIY